MNREKALQIARDSYKSSTTYFDANFRKQMEDALRMFQSKHPMDSKYNSEAYKYRSKLFRPKTRSVIRKNEAAAATAYFANMDVVNVAAADEKNELQTVSAQMYKELLQYRLTKTIPWFMTVIGALQDALTVGVAISHQSWSYKEKAAKRRDYTMDESGAAVMGFDGPVYQEAEQTVVLEDKPCIELRPVENIRIDPGASWVDPINTSPYLIDMIPMYVVDLKAMGQPNKKTGEPGWQIPDDNALRAATKQQYDSTRQVREGNREDSKQDNAPAALSDYAIVWVHKNIARYEGEDWCWFTLGVEHVLCDPKPLSAYSPLKKRPYVMGVAIIETHKVYPAGYPELGREVQKEIIEVTNSRMDNVKLAINKRFKVRRGRQVDLKSLTRNAAGSVTFVNEMDDVEAFEFNDVTSSSFQEHDRLNVEYDELTGNFSGSSVMTNRKLNETVGGMAMMNQGANMLTEYTLRTFTETWTEPVLGQIIELEKHYETDAVVLKRVVEKIGQALNDQMFDTDVELSVNVGMGATDPMMKLNKLLAGSKAYAEIASMMAPGLDLLELGKEIFGYIGYRDGGRFISEEQDPKLAQAMGMIQALQNALGQAQEALENKDAMEDAEIKAIAIELQDKSRKVAAEIDKLQADTLKSLAEAGVMPNAAMKALGMSPERMTVFNRPQGETIQ